MKDINEIMNSIDNQIAITNEELDALKELLDQESTILDDENSDQKEEIKDDEELNQEDILDDKDLDQEDNFFDDEDLDEAQPTESLETKGGKHSSELCDAYLGSFTVNILVPKHVNPRFAKSLVFVNPECYNLQTKTAICNKRGCKIFLKKVFFTSFANLQVNVIASHDRSSIAYCGNTSTCIKGSFYSCHDIHPKDLGFKTRNTRIGDCIKEIGNNKVVTVTGEIYGYIK